MKTESMWFANTPTKKETIYLKAFITREAQNNKATAIWLSELNKEQVS